MLSNCGHDENGRYSYGQAGDQTGTEWQIIPWYFYNGGDESEDKGWNYVLRHPNARVRYYISEFAKQAAQNNNIGYDQNERYTFWDQLTRIGFYPMNIKTPCETDCSAGVLAICKAVGYVVGDGALQSISPYGYTGNERQILVAAGFQALNAEKYLTSDQYLFAGDILLNTVNHTCISVTDGIMVKPEPVVDENFYLKTKTVYKGEKNIYVYRGKLLLKARGYFKGTLNWVFDKELKEAVKAFQKKAGLVQTGSLNQKTWATLLGLERRKKDGYWIVNPVCEGHMGNKSVLLCQEIMKGLGYWNGSLNWNWKKGDGLREAVIKIQKEGKLKVNGCFDKTTAEYLLGEHAKKSK